MALIYHFDFFLNYPKIFFFVTLFLIISFLFLSLFFL